MVHATAMFCLVEKPYKLIMFSTRSSYGTLPALNPTASLNASRRPSAVSMVQENEDYLLGFDAVKDLQHLHGFVKDHIMKMMDFVERHNIVIAFRPVNPMATSLIEEGYPTKSLEVKGKTADWGPHAGFIPVDQRLSKADDPEAATEEVKACIEAKHAKAVPLELSQKRVDELVRMNKLTLSENKREKTFRMTCDNGEEFHGKITSDVPPKYQVMRKNGDPLYVLAKADGPKAGMPMTADYDILIFAPHISDYGPQDKPRASEGRGSISSIDAELSSARRGSQGLLQIIRKNSSLGEDMPSSDKGTISERLENMLPDINTTLDREEGNELVQHGPDTWNPATDMDKNLPTLVFAPRRVALLNGVGLARTGPGLRYLFQQVKNAHYQFFRNERWDPDAVPMRESPVLSDTNIFSDSPVSTPELGPVMWPPSSHRGSGAFLQELERRTSSSELSESGGRGRRNAVPAEEPVVFDTNIFNGPFSSSAESAFLAPSAMPSRGGTSAFLLGLERSRAPSPLSFDPFRNSQQKDGDSSERS